MKFCALDIFLDPSILSIGESLTNPGECLYSERQNVPLIPLSFLGEILENLFSLYILADEENEGVDLIDHILDFWPGLFDLGKAQKARLSILLENILEDTETLDTGLVLCHTLIDG